MNQNNSTQKPEINNPDWRDPVKLFRGATQKWLAKAKI